MSGWKGFTVIAPTCHLCGAQLELGDTGISDPRDEREAEHARNALAFQTHRAATHDVDPQVGDLVEYAAPWRGIVAVSDVYRVVSIRLNSDFHAFARSMRGDDLAPLLGTSYTLVNPHKRDDLCFPFRGDPSRPLTFEIVTAAPPVQVDLFANLDWDEAAA